MFVFLLISFSGSLSTKLGEIIFTNKCPSFDPLENQPVRISGRGGTGRERRHTKIEDQDEKEERAWERQETEFFNDSRL